MMPVARQVDVLGRLGVLGLAADVVELHAEGIGEDHDGLAKDPRPLLGERRRSGVVDRIAETHDLLGLRVSCRCDVSKDSTMQTRSTRSDNPADTIANS